MRSLIKFMANNPVAANLFMLVFILGGLFSGHFIKQEIFPDIELDIIEISVSYFGAGPEDIEEGILLQIEDALRGIDGIKEIRSIAREGVGQVFVEVYPDKDTDQVLQDIKNAVDRIVTFPDAAERPVIRRLLRKRQVLYLAVYGDASQTTLRFWAERIRDKLLSSKRISQVEITGTTTHEITIYVSENNLRKYNLTLEQIAKIVKESSIDIPAGQIKTSTEQIQIRTKGKRYYAKDFKNITVLTKDFGLIPLGQIAQIKDSFKDIDLLSRFDGKPSVMIEVYRTGDEKPTEISKIVHNTVREFSEILPSTIHLSIWKDRSQMLKDRIALLLKNAFLGLILVIIILGLFLELKLAFWVMLGIPISFLGAIAIMPFMNVSINMISLFAFIMALGIVVDDAIVVGENIFEHRKRGESPIKAAVSGTIQVAGPVILSIATSILAFLPLLFIEGSTGKFIGVIPKIVISILLISLFECLFILPCHLTNSKEIEHFGSTLRKALDRRLKIFLDNSYSKAISWLMRNRYFTISTGLAFLIVTIGLIGGGIIKFHFMPKIESDTIKVTIKMASGTSIIQTAKVAKYIEKLALKTVKHFEKEHPHLFRHIYTKIDKNAQDIAYISLFLAPANERGISSNKISNYWRSLIGPIPGVEYIKFKNDLVRMGENIHIRIFAKDFKVLEGAGKEIIAKLEEYPGVLDISTDMQKGQREIQIILKPEAKALGLTTWSLGNQIRAAFYGAEALRMMRGENEVWVMSKYPENERRTLSTLYHMRVVTPEGMRIPLIKAAKVKEIKTYNVINRVDRNRALNITASVDEKLTNAKEVIDDLKETFLKDLKNKYLLSSVTLEGESRRSSETMASMKKGFLLALLAMYVLLAIPFKSYKVPVIIMLTIPLGVVGGVWGHFLLGYSLSIMSLFGMVALSGVVVNDSLLLLDYIRLLRSKGVKTFDAAIIASKRRFRPIILTSLTTFFGLAPMLLETSLHAKFLIPMAISLAFGILFATLITLFFIPAVYLAFEEMVKWVK